MSVDSSQPKLPDFFIVGQPKCGTTALYEMLRQHPEVFMPGLKEPNFFITEAHYRNRPADLDEYQALFEPAVPGQRIGEASTQYLASQSAAQGIFAARPDARIIAILREPAALLRSLHLQLLESRVEVEGDLRKALALEPDRRAGRVHRGGADQAPMLFYSSHVRYVEQLRRFHDRFTADQILILIYDDFRADNAAAVARISDFLEIDGDQELGGSRANPTVAVRSPRLDQLVHSVSVGSGPVSRFAKRGIKAMTPQRVRRRGLGAVERRVVQQQPQPPDEALMGELREQYRPEVEALGDYLGRDLITLWGYRSVAG